MPFVSSCCCPRHVEWKHGEVTSDQLRSCSREEIRWLDIDSDLKSKGRKRKICISCRYRLQIDLKCQKLEVSWAASLFIAVSHRVMIARIHVDVDFPDSAKYNGHVLWV